MKFQFWKKKDTANKADADEQERWTIVAISFLVLLSVIAGIWMMIYALTR